MRQLLCIAFAILAVPVPPSARGAEPAEPAESPPAAAAGGSSLKTSIGFTLTPDEFLLGLEWEQAITEEFRIGPLAQFGVSDDTAIIAPTANFKYVVPLPDEPPELVRLKPFVQGGLGFAYIHKDRRGDDDDEVGFLMNAGFGFDYFLTDHFALGSNMLFNVLPVETSGEHFFFSWQVLTATIRL